MPAAIFHLTNVDNPPHRYAIEQGATFSWLTLVLDGDYTTWTPRGQIRNNYASNGGTAKAVFSFPALVMGTATLPGGGNATGTIIKPTLTDEQTQLLDWAESKMQARSKSSEPALPGKNVWVYDIELESPSGEVMRLVQGFVEISLEATR